MAQANLSCDPRTRWQVATLLEFLLLESYFAWMKLRGWMTPITRHHHRLPAHDVRVWSSAKPWLHSQCLPHERIPVLLPFDHHLFSSSLGLSDAASSMLHAAESHRSLNPRKLRPRHSVPLLLPLLLVLLLLRFGTGAKIGWPPSASTLAGSHVSDDGMSDLDVMICVSKSEVQMS